MPIFEFRCSRCEHTFEEIVSRGTERLPCPECGRDDAVQRLLSAFSFKSGGTYSSSAGKSCSSCAGGHCSTCH